jgi:uncharacterized protein YndB with AHSA1/START domain
MRIPVLILGVVGFTALAALTASSPQETAGAGASVSTPSPFDPSPLVHEIDLNVPVEDVWRVFSTAEGCKLLGVAQAEVDFRVGGRIRTHYDPNGVLGDDGTIENTIIAFEPMRMVAFRITKTPRDFPFKDACETTWSVATMTDLGGARTHLRLAGMGYTPDPESQRMRAFFDQGNALVLQELKTNLEKETGAMTRDLEPGDPGGGPSEPSGASPARGDGSAVGAVNLSSIRTEAVVHAPLAEVWKCWTTSAGIASFLTDAKVELGIGGPFEIYFVPDAPAGQRGSEGCAVLSYEPMRMLSFSWNAPPKFGELREKRTWVVLHFDPEGAQRCRVRLQHLGFAEQVEADPARAEDWAQIRAYFDKAWPRVLAALQHHFEPSDASP